MGLTEHRQDHEAALRAWDWRAELTRQERGIPWLARHTDRSQNTVYKYAWGLLKPSVEWLESAARVLGRTVPQ
jgi:hypothetical protein